MNDRSGIEAAICKRLNELEPCEVTERKRIKRSIIALTVQSFSVGMLLTSVAFKGEDWLFYFTTFIIIALCMTCIKSILDLIDASIVAEKYKERLLILKKIEQAMKDIR